ncbi:hypothetical protein JHK85_051474 [Glycine max]|nr:hypothetical protein JHK85_051474 [Glycine max]
MTPSCSAMMLSSIRFIRAWFGFFLSSRLGFAPSVIDENVRRHTRHHIHHHHHHHRSHCLNHNHDWHRLSFYTVSWKIMVWLALFVKGVRTLRIVMKSSKDNPDSLMGIHNNSNAITWSPPLHNFVKVNTDVAVVFDRRVATYGEVIRVLTMVSLWVSLPVSCHTFLDLPPFLVKPIVHLPQPSLYETFLAIMRVWRASEVVACISGMLWNGYNHLSVDYGCSEFTTTIIERVALFRKNSHHITMVLLLMAMLNLPRLWPSDRVLLISGLYCSGGFCDLVYMP